MEERKNLTGNNLHSLGDIVLSCGFPETAPPDDSRCPVSAYIPEFAPSHLLDEARSGWLPKLIRKCIGCELCSTCPETSFALCADKLLLLGGIREGNFQRAFGGALEAVVSLQLKPETKQKRLKWVNSQLKIAEAGEVALFVGCAPYYDALLSEQIGFKATDEARAAVELLNAVGVKPVLLEDEVCCGADRLHAGDSDSFHALGLRNRDLLKARGVKTIVTICNDCRFTLQNRYLGRIPEWDFEVTSLADFLIAYGGKLAFIPWKKLVAVQPPDRYSDPKGLNSVNKLLERIPEIEVALLPTGHPSTFGSWNQFDAVSKAMETALLKSADSTGASIFLSPSLRVLVRLFEGRRPGSWEETSIALGGFYDFLAKRHAVTEDFAGA